MIKPSSRHPFIQKPKSIITEDAYQHHYEDIEGFRYFEDTIYEKLDFNAYLYMTWFFFTKEGVAYVLARLIETGYDVNNLSNLHTSFIEDFAIDANLYSVLDILPEIGVIELKEWFEYLLFNTHEKQLYDIGESYLLRNLEKIELFLYDVS